MREPKNKIQNKRFEILQQQQQITAKNLETPLPDTLAKNLFLLRFFFFEKNLKFNKSWLFIYITLVEFKFELKVAALAAKGIKALAEWVKSVVTVASVSLFFGVEWIFAIIELLTLFFNLKIKN